MATLARQPFAPLNEARLQNLTSLKNRQNAISPVSGKRKASELGQDDDFENVDPLLFSKRSKASGNAFCPTKDVLKSPSYVLKTTRCIEPSTPARSLATPKPRTTLQAKSPITKLNTSIAKASPLSAPAGRSPTRGKRSGILNRRRTVGQYARVDPPQFNLAAGAPFSLDAALKGTIPSYAGRPAVAKTPVATSAATTMQTEPLLALQQGDMKASWFFDIHEDTPEQEMTNLLQHSTCVLDISSDEESEQKANRERAEGRDKENIPPVDDVSQTSNRRAARRPAEDEMVVEKERLALGEMNVAEFYGLGCDETSVVLIPADEEESEAVEEAVPAVATPEAAPVVDSFEFAPEINVEPLNDIKDVDELMAKVEPCSKAALLEPIEGTGESFDLWESGSSKDDAEASPAVTETAAES